MTTHPCARCGKPCNVKYDLCWSCHQAAEASRKFYATQSVDLGDDYPEEQPPDEYCVMCGREWGTDLHSDGKYYCATCWTIWNS